MSSQDIQQLRRVLRWARADMGWERKRAEGAYVWSDGAATEVIWDPEIGLLSITRQAPFTNERRGADVEIASIGEALDVLSALHVLPLIYAPAYRDGVQTGTVTAERVAHEHYNRIHARVVHELQDDIAALGAFVDRQHDWKPGTDCRATPGVDCVKGCAACLLLAGLDGEDVARIRAERGAR